MKSSDKNQLKSFSRNQKVLVKGGFWFSCQDSITHNALLPLLLRL